MSWPYLCLQKSLSYFHAQLPSSTLGLVPGMGPKVSDPEVLIMDKPGLVLAEKR